MTGDEIDPMEFKQMLDAGNEVIVLDTRNEYECRIGTLRMHWNLTYAHLRLSQSN